MVDRTRSDNGPLVMIGGHEDKRGRRMILAEVAGQLRGGWLVIATVASHHPEGYFDSYLGAFGTLGISDLVELYVKDHAEALTPVLLEPFEGATGVFFTGGNQLLGAAAQSPRELGLGFDEGTAVILRQNRFEVIGSGGAYVVDGGGVPRSNIAEAEPERALSLHDVRMHALADSDGFDLALRWPQDNLAKG